MLALFVVTLLFSFIGIGLFFVGVVDSSVFSILLFSFSFLWLIFALAYYLARSIQQSIEKERESTEVIDEVAASIEKEKVPTSFSVLGATLLLIGITVFGGWLLASFTGNTTHLMPEDYIEWRISVTAMFFLYLIILFIYVKIKRKH